MPIREDKIEEWAHCVDINDDPYGKCCVDVAREAMKLLDERVGEIDCHKLICDADEAINAGGITGFMAGCVAQMISTLHTRGEEFRVAWNKPYLHDREDNGGVVNPAIMTIEL